MSLETFLKPMLNNPSSEDGEWYVKATYQALNLYMTQLESVLSIPNQMVNGVTTVPSTPPVPTPVVGQYAYFMPTRQRFTYPEVKAAMFCGDANLTFPNLFNLFGTKFALNFMNLLAFPVLNVTGTVILPTTSFMTCANELMLEARSVGAAMTPELFCQLESLYLQMAIQTIPPMVVPLLGVGLIPTGSWVGTATIQFGTLTV